MSCIEWLLFSFLCPGRTLSSHGKPEDIRNAVYMRGTKMVAHYLVGVYGIHKPLRE